MLTDREDVGRAAGEEIKRIRRGRWRLISPPTIIFCSKIGKRSQLIPRPSEKLKEV